MDFEMKLFITNEGVEYRMYNTQPENDNMVSVIAGNGPIKHLRRCDGSVVDAFKSEVVGIDNINNTLKCKSGNVLLDTVSVRASEKSIKGIKKVLSKKTNCNAIIYEDSANKGIWHLYAYEV